MNRRAGTTDRKVGPQSCEDTDLEGIGAEIVFARIMNAYPDLNVGHRPVHDVVVMTPGGCVTVDVKTTKHPRGRLLAVTGKIDKPPQFYALMVGSMPTYRFAGAIPAGNLLQESRLGDLGYGPTYMMPQQDLLPWDICVRNYSGF